MPEASPDVAVTEDVRTPAVIAGMMQPMPTPSSPKPNRIAQYPELQRAKPSVPAPTVATAWPMTNRNLKCKRPLNRTIKGQKRKFFGYMARGVPDGPDDGSIAPWAVLASLPFAPQIVLPALRYFKDIKLDLTNPYGFKATFNPTFSQTSDPSKYWISPSHYGLNQGPIVLMIENYRSGLVWRLMRQCPHLVNGLRRAGFSGGWLDGKMP